MQDEEMAIPLKNISFDNLKLLEEYFQTYKSSPQSLDTSWGHLFTTVPEKSALSTAATAKCDQIRIEQLITAYRSFGFLAANVDPLNQTKSDIEELKLVNLGFLQAENRRLFPTCSLCKGEPFLPLEQIVSTLQSIYTKRIGIEYFFPPFTPNAVASWIQEHFESLRGTIPLTIEQKYEIFRLLSQAELFETFLHTRFVGQKRFSLEGCETLVPMLWFIMEQASTLGAEDIVLGMSHRGRLNVLANIFQKPLSAIISEFHGKAITDGTKTSDVKYHKGFSSTIESRQKKALNVKMCPNPSHLESVNAVVLGETRAKQRLKNGNQNAVVPILIHGDAAISGQGVVYESLQLSKLSGYTVGGTIHIVINNQIGFTALPEDSRSTLFCTDIAKAFGFPVFHVNAEDVESSVWAALSALQLRNTLHTDVFINLNCYRKYGHNESDEPAFTQPVVYDLIRKKKSIRELFYERLLKEGNIDRAQIEDEYRKALHTAFEEVKENGEKQQLSQPEVASATKQQKISYKALEELAGEISTIPENVTIHPKLKKNLDERLVDLRKEKELYRVDFSFAEALAIGTILQESISCRLVGQDSRRGTFSQRHAAICDQNRGTFYYPFNHLKKRNEKTFFEVYDSSLSEYAALGFEYGYSIGDSSCLVLWEAQFGDFANGAQIIIDQYIAAGESKWGSNSALILLLPHGYEGQGPEHSSARMERYLALAAENNICIVNPTTAAQYFHLLRRQAFSLSQIKERKPLIIFTPKGLLRYPACTSSLQELTDGKFQEIIDDTVTKENIECLAFCQGKIYYDLLAKREKLGDKKVALIRIASYPHATKFLWVQEEPMNAGAWSFIQAQGFAPFHYVGRKPTASPAVGSHEVHAEEQKEIIDAVFLHQRFNEKRV